MQTVWLPLKGSCKASGEGGRQLRNMGSKALGTQQMVVHVYVPRVKFKERDESGGNKGFQPRS